MEQGETSTATPPNQVCSGTVCVSRKLVPRREVKQIHVRSGALIDFIEFAFTTGEPLKIGEGKGDEQEPFTLEPGEVITEIHGGQGALLDRVQFVTSLGRTSSAYGGTGGENFTFKVTEGKMITGLDRAAARRSLDAKEVELGKLRLKIEDSTGTHAAYKALQKCGESTVGEYSYKICPFEDAKQGHVSLGRWKGWAMDNPHTGLFEGGERCFSGIVRSLRVTFECGEDYAIESVKEPSQCVYEATMTHPAACDPKAFEIGEDRVLGPHEAHVEL
ncbi:unnamed protein product [Durusdinium trenchii]|uniref:MRH domain-containing protein n=3 Tax=Durusdinium trenchii TaxID=1381693 RepID=A0ABP0S2J9_9DINO